ncbi:alpha/beta fold hydrolase [Hahella aquimaris]|uniref:esterase/lipase family protein n=1 Tax=Hahella sp. HNIBRBA332 TaxID=3015983 RepID=UPI00273B5D41|nr:alpha/beta fold hydrolase [Hahella sp. HNIBRBA332]WLQ12409.1 alpha/beta fold hydrolase [Hahella sp. HNIBRBA332]
MNHRPPSLTRPPVALLHGLARTSRSLNTMQRYLDAQGFDTFNLNYPSTRHSLESLATQHIYPALLNHFGAHSSPIHFVTHSMGGILVRVLNALKPDIPIGRVVMLSPPNQGSEVVDKLGKLALFQLINGPAGGQLDTANNGLLQKLGSPDFECGVITGDRSVNPLLSLMIKGPNDGKVSVERAKLTGMRDFLVLPASHPFIMRNQTALEHTLHFLREGRFQHKR